MCRARVLQLITLSDRGGAQGVVFALARGLRDRYDVTVACAPGGPLVTRLSGEGIHVVELPAMVRTPHLFKDVRTLRQLTRWLHRERFALVHCHSTKAGLLGRLAAARAGVPAVVFTAHAWPFTEGWPVPVRVGAMLAERVVARWTTAIICVTDQVRRDALRMRIGTPAQLHVIPNGIDPRTFLDGSVERVRSGPPAVVAVGRLRAPKDPGTLLRAWALVRGEGRLRMIGDGPQRPDAEALARRLALAARVEFMGERDDIPSLLREAEVFVLSSRWEGMPLAVVEAMFSGLPVVATAVGGVGDVVVHGETGLLVPPGDPLALAAALQRLLDDRELRRAMGSAGRARALAMFTEERMVARTAEVYERLLAGRRFSPARSDPPAG